MYGRCIAYGSLWLGTPRKLSHMTVILHDLMPIILPLSMKKTQTVRDKSWLLFFWFWVKYGINRPLAGLVSKQSKHKL